MMSRLMAMILVTDRERARGFYRDVLGPVLGIGALAVDDFGDQFACGDGFIRLTLIPDWVPGPHPALGWQVADAADCAARLTAAGAVMQVYPGMGQDDQGIWHAPDGKARIAWFNDSEGNLLSIAEQR